MNVWDAWPKDASWLGLIMEERDCWFTPRIAVEAAMPIEPPRTRTWAMMPWATAWRVLARERRRGRGGGTVVAEFALHVPAH